MPEEQLEFVFSPLEFLDTWAHDQGCRVDILDADPLTPYGRGRRLYFSEKHIEYIVTSEILTPNLLTFVLENIVSHYSRYHYVPGSSMATIRVGDLTRRDNRGNPMLDQPMRSSPVFCVGRRCKQKNKPLDHYHTNTKSGRNYCHECFLGLAEIKKRRAIKKSLTTL